jgi:hypothetical protein
MARRVMLVVLVTTFIRFEVPGALHNLRQALIKFSI